MHWCVIRRYNCFHITKLDEASLSMNCWRGNQVRPTAEAFAYEKLLKTGCSHHHFIGLLIAVVHTWSKRLHLPLSTDLVAPYRELIFGERKTIGGTYSSTVKSGDKWTDTWS